MFRTTSFVIVSPSKNGCVVTCNSVSHALSFSSTEERLFPEAFFLRVIGDIFLSAKGDISLVTPSCVYHRVHEALLYKEKNREISPNLLKPWMLKGNSRARLARNVVLFFGHTVAAFPYNASVTTQEISLRTKGLLSYTSFCVVKTRERLVPVVFPDNALINLPTF